MYLHLLNGRTNPNQNTDGNGTRGPIIGPCFVKFVYGKVQVFEPETLDREFVPMYEDMLFVNGVYYGDMSVLTAEQAEKLEQQTNAPRLTAEQFLALISLSHTPNIFTS